MKLMYQGPAPLDPMHVRRQRRRAWVKEVCWEALGALATVVAIWALIILMFVM